MNTFIRRLDRLERNYETLHSKPAFRFLVSFPWKGPVNWTASKCSRKLNPDGGLIESIVLEGDSAND